MVVEQATTIAESIIRANIGGLVSMAKHLSSLEHGGVKGLLREALLDAVLRPMLPTPYKAGTGVIVDVQGRQSGQCDLIIWDDSILAPLYMAGNAGLFPIEAVVAVVEVKSKLVPSDFTQIFRVFSGLKEMIILDGKGNSWEDEPEILPLSLLFAFKSNALRKSEYERLCDVAEKHNILDPAQYIQAITVPGKTSWILSPNEIPKEYVPDDKYREVIMPICGLFNSLSKVSSKRLSRGPVRRGSYLVRK